MSVPILIPHASGTNRDLEAAQAIELAGGTPTIAHVNELRSGAVRIADHAQFSCPEASATAMHSVPVVVWRSSCAPGSPTSSRLPPKHLDRCSASATVSRSW